MGDNNKYIVDSVDCYNSQNNYQNACVIFYNHKETMYYRIVTNHVKTGRIYGSIQITHIQNTILTKQ